MKKIILLIIVATALFSGTMNLEVSNIKNQKGMLSIGLYNEAKSFPIKTAVYQGAMVDINSTFVRYQFQNIPNGTYAIALFHDENRNEIMDKNFLGIPKEGYGFSNNVKALFLAPSFNEAKFELKESLTLKIEMDYR